jgi:hypothetical protein
VSAQSGQLAAASVVAGWPGQAVVGAVVVWPTSGHGWLWPRLAVAVAGGRWWLWLDATDSGRSRSWRPGEGQTGGVLCASESSGGEVVGAPVLFPDDDVGPAPP